MGRRRRRVVRVVKRRLPRFFLCPSCGQMTISVRRIPGAMAEVRCGSCGSNWKREAGRAMENIDIYNAFIDEYYSGEISIISPAIIES